MGQNGRMRDDNQGWRSHHDRDREFEDRDEGNRWGDRPMPQMQRDRYATGQSGYSSGRSGEDPSLNYQNRNQAHSGRYEDRQSFGTDDRFTGRGGEHDYARGYGDRNYDQSFGRDWSRDRDDRGTSIYDHREDNRSFRSRDYGPSESDRGMWSTQTQRQDNERAGRGRMEMDGPHRGKGPRGYTRSDERIKEHVCEALTDHSHIDASGIDVEVKNGEVILSGMVPDRRTKRMAEDLIEGLSGVKDISNQLKISDDERQNLGRSHQTGNQNGNGAVSHEEPRNGTSDKKARA